MHNFTSKALAFICMHKSANPSLRFQTERKATVTACTYLCMSAVHRFCPYANSSSHLALQIDWDSTA